MEQHRLKMRARMGRGIALCALFCLALPLAAGAGQDDNGPVTLRMKFKEGGILYFKNLQKMSIKIDAGGLPVPEIPPTTTTMVTEQKVVKLRPEGGAVYKTATKHMHVVANGQEQAAPEVPTMTTEVDATGKVLTMEGMEKGSGQGFEAINQLIGRNGLSGISSFLPDRPVKVGDTWEKEVAMPEMLGKTKSTMKCSFVKVETVGKYKTAVIHTEMTVPLKTNIGKNGQPSSDATDAMATMNGNIVSTGDIHFAIEEGHIVRMTNGGGGTIDMKFNKEALGAAGAQVPDGMKMDIKMDMESNLMSPEEAKTLDKPAPAKPAPKKKPSKPKKRGA